MTTPSTPDVHGVMLLGFGEFERSALLSCVELSRTRFPAYQVADSLSAAHFVVADADHAEIVDAVGAAHRTEDTVFIGTHAPDGALAWLMRPVDPLQVLHQFDVAVTLRHRSPTPPSQAGNDDAATSRPARHRDSRAPITALLIDANEVARRALARQLQALGLRIDTARDSQQALDLMDLQHYAVVFLDVELGPASALDGLGLCRRIKRRLDGTTSARLAAPKVVLVSAQATATDRVRGSFVGCDAYLTKPPTDDALTRQLRALGLLALNAR